MPRGRKKIVYDNVDEKIKNVEAEIKSLSDELKVKRTERRKLLKAKAAADEIALAKKAEADKEKVVKAFMASGKSLEEVLELLK